MDTAPEAELIRASLELLAGRLPPGWTVERVAGQGAGPREGDVRFAFNSQYGGGGDVAIVEARRNFVAADVDRLLGGLTRRLREAADSRPILLVSEFLAPRTRELLAKEDINYLDLTGNVRLVMRTPPLFVEAVGAGRRPAQMGGTRRSGLPGARVGRVVRFLAEVVPPYGVTDIERATGIGRGYVSRILDRLTEEALITKEPRGRVERVEWPALLRLRGQSVDLFKANATRTYVTPSGARALFDALQKSGLADRVVVTGSFAAVRKAPVAAPVLLALYRLPDGRPPNFESIAGPLGLLPADEGADLALLVPTSDLVVEDTWAQDGLRFVNLPQLVVDCLGGTGRMPSEAEAVLAWMQTNPHEWQYPSIEAYDERRR